MVTETLQETNRPYAPPSNVIAVLQRLRSRNLPEHVDAEYLRDAGVSEGTVGRTLSALRFLTLVTEEDEPTQALRSIHTATNEEYQAILAGLVRDAYAEVFNVLDPAEDGQERILNVFRRYTPASQRSRMVIFFLGVCREAGIPTLDVPRQRSMREPHPGAKANSPISRTQTRQQGSKRKQVDNGAGGGGGGIHPALDGLIAALPAVGQPLSEPRLDQWVLMARATLRFIYPETEAAPEPAEEEDAEA
jgi:hypothetical protein